MSKAASAVGCCGKMRQDDKDDNNNYYYGVCVSVGREREAVEIDED